MGQISRLCTIFLVVGDGLDRLLINSVRTLRAAKYREDIHVFLVDQPSARLRKVFSRLNIDHTVLDTEAGKLSETYSNFGTSYFNVATHLKWTIIQRSFAMGYDLVVYSDCDIGFKKDFTRFVKSLSQYYVIAMQSAASPHFPMVICTGFMVFKRTWLTRLLLFWFQSRTKKLQEKHDQDYLNEFLKGKRLLRKKIYLLPESKFPLGHLKQFVLPNPLIEKSSPRSVPFLFHANWTKGLESKEQLLREAGLWVVD